MPTVACLGSQLPYRGVFGAARPACLGAVALPPGPMPSHHAGRPLKAWRYIGVFGPELMLCLGSVRIGPGRQSFWAIWDRDARRWHERTRYYERHTRWSWCAGLGHVQDGRELAWSLVRGVNDPPRDSERTIWIDGVAREAPPVRFDGGLTSVGGLRFSAEASRERRENRLLVRSTYRQPFGRFAGELPGGLELADGYGVMEEHDVWW